MSPVGRMRRHLARIQTEPGLKKNFIAVTAMIALALVAGGGILANERFTPPWVHKYTVEAEFEAVPGISPGHGQEVRIAGIIVGQITGAHVGADGHALVTMQLDRGQKVYRNAELVLRPKSPLNEMYVEINPGGPPAAPVPSGGVLPVTNTRRPVQIDEVLGHLDDHARSALTTLLSESDVALASAPHSLAPGVQAASALLTDLRPVVDQLDQRREYLQRLVTALSQISEGVGRSDDRITGLAQSLDTTLSAAAENDGQLRSALAQLPALTSRLQTSTSAVQRLSEQLDPTLRDVGRATRTLPKALQKVSDTTGALQKTVALAAPVAAQARPVVNDLRPFVSDLSSALPTVELTTARLDPVTAALLKYLPDLGAFFVQTRSFTSLRDANGGIIRGMLQITPTSLPIRSSLPGTHSTYPKP